VSIERYYIVGLQKSGRIYAQVNLKPMTHKQAGTFISNMMNPTHWIRLDVPGDYSATRYPNLFEYTL
jgi:hypothetical protein